jgi:hypothetical protein
MILLVVQFCHGAMVQSGNLVVHVNLTGEVQHVALEGSVLWCTVLYTWPLCSLDWPSA